MASVTTRTAYTNGEAVETLRGSDGSVTQRVIEAQSRRIEAQLEAAAKSPYTLWDGNGKIKQVGGNAPYRPQQVQANSGLGKGDPVQDNGGLVSATPRAGDTTELQAQIRQQAETLTTVAKALGGQFGEGDPNSADPNNADLLLARPRYPLDTYYDEASGTLFKWNDDSANNFANSQWVAFQQLYQGFSGDPGDQGGSAIPVYVDGAIAINDDGDIYTGAVTGDGWTAAGGGVLSLTTDPTTAGTPVEENLLVIDKTTGTFYHADDSNPSVWVGQTDDLNGYIEATADKTYPLIANSTSAYTVVALNTGGSSTATVATSPAVGSTVSAGGNLGLVVSSSDGNDLSFTVRLRRV